MHKSIHVKRKSCSIKDVIITDLGCWSWIVVGSVSSLVLTIRWWSSLRCTVAVVVRVARSHHALVLVVDSAVVALPPVLPPVARAGELVVHGRTPPVHEHRLEQ